MLTVHTSLEGASDNPVEESEFFLRIFRKLAIIARYCLILVYALKVKSGSIDMGHV